MHNDNKRFIKDVIRFFGITNNVFECGYLLEDGRMLDFSATNLKVGLFDNQVIHNHRNLIHDNFFGINKENYSLSFDDIRKFLLNEDRDIVTNFMRISNSVRVDKSDHICSFIKINNNQINTLLKMFEDDSLIIGQIDENGLELRSDEIQCVTKKKLLEFVNCVEH